MLFDQGRISASDYQTSNALIDIVLAWRSYVVHVGGCAGAIAAMVVFGERKGNPTTES